MLLWYGLSKYWATLLLALFFLASCIWFISGKPQKLRHRFFFPLSSTFLCELPSFSLNVTLKSVVKTLFCWHLWVTHNMETVGTVISSSRPLLSAIKGKLLTLSPFSDWCACHTHPTSWSALCLYCGVSPRNPICVFRPVKITQL